MVYKILGKDVININHNSSYIIAISATGEFALLYSTETLEREQIDDADVNALLQTPEWKQPCINCN